ncbi:hypothetical protein CMI37_29495 [Candidatus Pacearchaeota archaeon]|nr:hypothetical protein [Candidatus Pacearchaeota archaeon]
MVSALIALSTRVQSNMAIIRGGVSRGLTSKQIQGLITQTGQTGVRRTDLLKGIRYAKGVQDTGPYLRSIRRDLRPNPARLPTSIAPMTRKYRFEVRIDGTNPLTRTQESHYVTVRSDNLLTPEEIENEAERLWNTGQSRREERYQMVFRTAIMETGAKRD